MAPSRPFRFGVLATEEFISSRDAWVSYARKVEDLATARSLWGSTFPSAVLPHSLPLWRRPMRRRTSEWPPMC